MFIVSFKSYSILHTVYSIPLFSCYKITIIFDVESLKPCIFIITIFKLHCDFIFVNSNVYSKVRIQKSCVDSIFRA